MNDLPQAYVERMRGLLGAEAEAFWRSYAEPRAYGLRLNPLKLSSGDPLAAAMTEAFGLAPVPWCESGRYYDGAARPGRHPWHAAGLYYIQEPSAMIAAELLAPRPGDIVLDLAAAPGGKTTQLAAAMGGAGLLVANEIHPARAKILAENVERLGLTNAIVTQASPQELSARFPAAFDRIMLDAPCSGEGMFRKDEEAVRQWSPDAVRACAARQRDIVPHAAAMLKPGGTLVYSTCTFNREENEETIAALLRDVPGFELVRQERLWPHRVRGEGHYAAVLRRSAEGADARSAAPRGREPDRRTAAGGAGAAERAALLAFRAFADEALPGFALPANGVPLLFGDSLHWLPQPSGSPITPRTMRGLRVPRPGLHLGDLLKNRFEPAHALAMAAAKADAALVADYPADSAETAAYLRGETLPGDGKGWGLACADGYPLGWFKASDGQRKNRRPKGLRSLS